MANRSRQGLSSSRTAPPSRPAPPWSRPRAPDPGLIGHAGLAARRLHGTPDRRHLEWAAGLGLDRLELDVCRTADGVIVVRHDHRLQPGNVRLPHLLGMGEPAGRDGARPGRGGRGPSLPGVGAGTPVAAVPLSTLRRLDPDQLTLDEAVEVLAGRVPLLLDLKGAGVAPPLGRWLRGRRDAGTFAVCTPSIAALHELRAHTPRPERWPTLPEFGKRRRDRVGGALATLWLTHNDPARVRHSLAQLGRAIGELPRSPQHAVASMASLPWRWRLPELAARWTREVRAGGLCVPHWLLTAELCAAARRLRLPLTAFTVNEEWAVRRALDLGASLLTTDEVGRVRRQLRRWTALAAEPEAGALIA